MVRLCCFSLYFILILVVVPTWLAVGKSQVVINEIYYDAPDSDTGYEWIELINTGVSSINLNGYDLKPDIASYYTFGDFILNPDSRVIIHVNTMGENTPTELYAGLSSNMGNTSGSIVLFSSTTHSPATIVDFVQYGAGGQTWESAAVTAGIWTEGDFAVDVQEGYSLNLNPDAVDNNLGSDWSECDPSPLNVNCPAITPTETPASTSTPMPTPTWTFPAPTNTPVPPTNTPPIFTQTPPPSTATITPVPPTTTPYPTSTATPAIPTTTPTPQISIAINEVFYDAPSSDTGYEWIEIINTGNLPVDMSGFDLKPESAAYYTFNSFILNNNARVVVHINTEGDDTDTELYAGLSSNMGNTSGSIVLFSSTTHSLSTIIDFVQYGAEGQTWESTAVDAGIWTTGDFVIDADEGFSINLDPDGQDNNVSSDWSSCIPTLLDINCVIPEPTETPTELPTISPSPTTTGAPPSYTPTNTPTSTPIPPSSVIINEVLYDPADSDSGLEWIELINPSDESIDLNGYDLKPDGAAYYTFGAFILNPGARVIIHINAEGDDTAQELFAGLSTNMGNTSGSVVLFSSTTHSPATIVDFVQYGAGGQTWESAAVDAGIWTAGDFVSDAQESYSINLDPDAVDNNNSSDWSVCWPTFLDVNCEEEPPTETPTGTPTLLPTDTPGPGTPTITPSPEATETPTIRMGVVINEVFCDPEGADTGLEFIELYNNSPDAIDISGYDLKPDDSPYYTLPTFILDSHCFVTVHINTEGTNSDTDLYTGASSNMGNSTGYIALFDSTTHSVNTIVDYIAYGAGGQTWESTAVNAGIWTEGDYAEPATEGKSLNLCPNGEDTDKGYNWQEDTISPGSVNPCNPPPPTETPTNTQGPSPTPTITPTPRPTVEPVIHLAGFADTRYRITSGGNVRLIAWITDPDNDIESVNVYFAGEPILELHDDGIHGDFNAGDNIYGQQFYVEPNAASPGELIRLLLKIVAEDAKGYSSMAWPFYSVAPEFGSPYTSTFQPLPWYLSTPACQSTQGTGTQIFMAGYMNSRVTASGGGDLQIIAVISDRDAIYSIELFYNGLGTGIFLADDGSQGDFNPNDGVYGLEISIEPGDLVPGDYFFQLQPYSNNGTPGDLWPYLTIND
ncbi:lamin tail domain-containing protein [bacterium]|nr:lamin tail domain-containing protein [candidate division CSSED10-310 bacterium]